MSPSPSAPISERIAWVESEIAAACRAAGRERSEVTLVAVSKRQPPERLQAALEAGLRVFGENYPQELERKAEAHPEAEWHMIGHLQRNKVKKVGGASLLHSVDSERLGQALHESGAERGRAVRGLLQINLAGEASKSGLDPSEAEATIEALRSRSYLRLEGLMTLPPPGEGRRYFAQLRQLAERLRGATELDLPDLSMGMSDDFSDAVAEGATLVRIGTALFGPRPG